MQPLRRIVLVETSPSLPGLFSGSAWRALDAATAVLARDPGAHPSVPYLDAAGIEVARLEPAQIEMRGLDLLAAGDPTDRRLARALLERADDAAGVAYLLGSDDGDLARTVGLEAARRGGYEVEFVFLDAVPPGAELIRLVDVVRRLRDPEDGCPWDLRQDHGSLLRYLIEETYELVEAVEVGDDDGLAEELGDVLLQVALHAQVAADRRAFGIDHVARGIADKLVRRHPHVFGDVEVEDADEVVANWAVLKEREKGERSGPFDGVPATLPGLERLREVQRAASKVGFDWESPAEPRERILSELEELAAAEDPDRRTAELGDLLGAVVGLARHLGVDPDAAARQAARTFADRFEAVLALAAAEGLPSAGLDRAGWLRLWRRVKHGDRPTSA